MKTQLGNLKIGDTFRMHEDDEDGHIVIGEYTAHLKDREEVWYMILTVYPNVNGDADGYSRNEHPMPKWVEVTTMELPEFAALSSASR